ncbi:hypothetical protein DTO013E5_9073 [Penicillium roqueforti]|uniref:Cofilin n=1 Tax=Penicillium roqueforti (strain FM164) TaxID=1365484 RepID=W6QE50_PENRF|nr:uncharacterized protein LCP9604111_7165 [Penicillium roqueforti]CDM27862.1 Actin-binding, cofilin/tropomyosin type [Penicillium roqueforti FM164]KAF9244773.1 hypothetical protein LCP9604111_7165 [Penicillium roqueforti]KAI1831207.1 hypothetical protein CBS147337_7965 [Penicillium roqueforti]KAI2680952.1 hypothetical protein LCP963914a_6903 [Penicillium roqueforti]KAI2690607.1 hypothetical protein CBS147355_1058 [Penicillium roqueforti]
MTKGFATITPECEEVFDEVKGTDNLNYVIYSASAHDKKITVAESGKYKDYAEFLSHFKDNAPLYAVVDFLYDSPAGDGQRSKLVFITWVPEAASIHDKSYYTSNKDHLFYALQDISLHVLAHSRVDLDHNAILGKFKAL